MPLLTPEQAKTKWCPRYQYVANYDETQQTGCMPIYAPGHCIADECAVWRQAAGSKRGYCGLGGPPAAVPARPRRTSKP